MINLPGYGNSNTPSTPTTPKYINLPGFSAAPKPSTDTPAAATKSGYSPSSQKDTYSGKPLATVPMTIPKTFMSPEVTTPVIDTTRIAPSFDPTVPQKLTKDMLQNGRMPESASQQIKNALGGNSSEELDHQIALELGGSNEKSNLKLEPNVPGTHNTATDPLENKLAKDVINGDKTGVSWIDAHRQLAKAKGFTLKEDAAKNNPLNDYLLNSPNILKPLASVQEGVEKVGSFFKNFFTGDTKTIDATFNALGGQAVVHPIQTIKNIIDSAKQGADTTLNNLITSAKTIGKDFNSPTRVSQKAGDILNFLGAAASTVLYPVSETFNIASQLPIIKPAADAAGLVFGPTGQVTGFTFGKILDVLPISQQAKDDLQAPVENVGSLAGQIVLGGYIFGKITGLMDAKGEVPEAKTAEIVKDAQAKAEEIDQAPIPEPPKPTLTDVIKQQETSETPKNEATESPITNDKTEGSVIAQPKTEVKASIAKELKPLAEEAKKYKSAEEFTKGINGKTLDLPTDFVKQFVRSRGGRSIGENISSLEKGFDKTKPIDLVINGDGTASLGDGNGRTLAASQLKMKSVPTRITINNNFSAKDFPESKPFSLTDFYNKATKKTVESEIVKPKSTPKSVRTGALKPIEGTGKIKVRGLSEGVEAKAIASTPSKLPGFAPEEAKALEKSAVASKLTDIFGDLPQYKQMNVADQGAKAIALFEKDPEAAKQVAYGAKTPPKGLTPEAVFVAVEQDAIERGDVQTLKELANSRLTGEATTMGQRIRMLAERNPEAPTNAIRQVQEARVKAVQEKLGKPIEEAKQEIVKDIKKKITEAKPKKIAWADFVQSITC